eukprot:TRINITY_DN3865_c0_g1_i1.p1 TRINITY_DN3865_c0_g1~~TRINITY_DN3865_c0_g1_i1.p1  ORF type:complete len:456 (+),score=194.26 TRINITY_DN3865_c0_g1_i1:46-1413(+)
MENIVNMVKNFFVSEDEENNNDVNNNNNEEKNSRDNNKNKIKEEKKKKKTSGGKKKGSNKKKVKKVKKKKNKKKSSSKKKKKSSKRNEEEQVSIFAPKGEEREMTWEDKNMVVIHGTSKKLMKKAAYLLKEEFRLNTKKDWKNYQKKKRYTYYVVVESMDGDDVYENTVNCAMRVVLDSLTKPKQVVIDFVRTDEDAQGQGIASRLVKYILEGCEQMDSNIWVVSTKEARSYWKRFGFIKEDNDGIDYEINEFADCTLMKLPSNNYEPKYDYYSETDSEEDEYSDEYEEDDEIYVYDEDSDYEYYYVWVSASDSEEDESDDDSDDDSDDEYSFILKKKKKNKSGSVLMNQRKKYQKSKNMTKKQKQAMIMKKLSMFKQTLKENNNDDNNNNNNNNEDDNNKNKKETVVDVSFFDDINEDDDGIDDNDPNWKNHSLKFKAFGYLDGMVRSLIYIYI